MAHLSAGLDRSSGSGSGRGAPLDLASLPHTYENALHLLSLLPTNRDVTLLFEGNPQQQSDDLNAMAIPEVVAWMARAGYPDLPRDLADLRCVHVAGTKGKGSVCAFVTAILVAAAGSSSTSSPGAGVGRVGTYLSPHVVSVRERIWLDGRPIARDLFARYTFELWTRLSAAAAAADPADPSPQGPHTKPFYFRFLTLLAFHVFLREGVRSAVVECGIGGEYDATNVLPANCVTAAAVTRLGIDHVAMLGKTLPEIAWHKAGIFKEGVAAFTLQGSPGQGGGGEGKTSDGSDETEAALAVLRARAREKKVAALYEVPLESVARWSGVPDAALPGAFQKYNMALAAAAARHHLRIVGGGDPDQSQPPFDLDPSTIPSSFREALAKATLRGRCETVYDGGPGVRTVWLVDGAHTSDSLREVAAFFAAHRHTNPNAATHTSPPRCILLFTVRDRQPADLIRALVAGAAAAGGGGGADDGQHSLTFDEALFVFPPDAAAARAAALDTMAAVSPSTAASAWDSVAGAVEHVRALAAAAAATAEEAGADTAADPGQPHCVVLATGSFALARDVLQELEADAEE